MTGALQAWLRLLAPAWAIGPVSRYGPGLEPRTVERELTDEEASQALSAAFNQAYARGTRVFHVSPDTVRMARQFGPKNVHHPDRMSEREYRRLAVGEWAPESRPIPGRRDQGPHSVVTPDGRGRQCLGLHPVGLCPIFDELRAVPGYAFNDCTPGGGVAVYRDPSGHRTELDPEP